MKTPEAEKCPTCDIPSWYEEITYYRCKLCGETFTKEQMTAHEAFLHVFTWKGTINRGVTH